jgi:hypothetical protein
MNFSLDSRSVEPVSPAIRQRTVEIPARLLNELQATLGAAAGPATVSVISCSDCGVKTEIIHGQKRKACTFTEDPKDSSRCVICDHRQPCHEAP